MIKPEAVENGHIGAILERINAAGFTIVALKKTHLSSELAGAFYAVHKERPFYSELVGYMWTYCCGHLRKDNAVADFRALIGATDPTEAEGTIRKEFASKAKNAVHGSDSDENADIEGAFFFSQFERFLKTFSCNKQRKPTRESDFFLFQYNFSAITLLTLSFN